MIRFIYLLSPRERELLTFPEIPKWHKFSCIGLVDHGTLSLLFSCAFEVHSLTYLIIGLHFAVLHNVRIPSIEKVTTFYESAKGGFTADELN